MFFCVLLSTNSWGKYLSLELLFVPLCSPARLIPRTLYRASTFIVKPSTPGMAVMDCSSRMSVAKWASKGTSWKNLSHTSGCLRSCGGNMKRENDQSSEHLKVSLRPSVYSHDTVCAVNMRCSSVAECLPILTKGLGLRITVIFSIGFIQ